MTQISQYIIIEKIYESGQVAVYRGSDQTDNKPVMIKLLQKDYPTPEDINHFIHEYTILRNLDIEGVIHVYDLVEYKNSVAIIEEDFGGKSLESFYAKKPIRIEEFLRIAVLITDNLYQIHLNRVIHKDINPANILWNPNSNQIKFIDFGISSALAHETNWILYSKKIEGTLNYISPEQTGRMNRPVDYRSDLYSLGITFYKLLTGEVPFYAEDEMELIHAHLAKQPEPAYHRNPNIPVALSAVVSKLMEKMPESRYQSAFGLLADLKVCLEYYQTDKQIPSFSLGTYDVAEQLTSSVTLYGKDIAIDRLNHSLRRIGEGLTELVFLYGPAGVGKTTLVYHFHPAVIGQNGFLITGRFDPLKQNTPFTAIIQAFRDFFQQILTHNEEKIAFWKNKLHTDFQPYGNLLLDHLPEAEILFDFQAHPLTVLSQHETHSLDQLLHQLMVAITDTGNPLVLFLDDLHWADSASMEFIQFVTRDTTIKNVMILGSYHTDEVDVSHPLMHLIQGLQKQNIPMQRIPLNDLTEQEVTQYISDLLQLQPIRVAPLSKLCFQKTKGNPYFLKQFLNTLYAKAFLRFDRDQARWIWNLPEIEKIEITDNVVDLMVRKIQNLSERTQTLLKMAACIGEEFDLRTLALLNQKSRRNTADELWDALQEELIIPQDKSFKFNQDLYQGEVFYRFLHNRVQQAAYSLLCEEEKKNIHYEIGKILLAYCPDFEKNIWFYEIVNHLNQAKGRLANTAEKDELISFNFIACEKTKQSGSVKQAYAYLLTGLDLFDDGTWQRMYEKSLAYYTEALELAFLNEDYVPLESFAEAILSKATCLNDSMKVYEIRMQAYTMMNRAHEAMGVVREILSRLGLYLPEEPTMDDVLLHYHRIKGKLSQLTENDLLDLPLIKDPISLQMLQIIASINSFLYTSRPYLFTIIVLAGMDLTVQYGSFALTPHLFVLYGSLLCGILKDIEKGAFFGDLGMALFERSEEKIQKGRLILLHINYIKPWVSPIQESIHDFKQIFQQTEESLNHSIVSNRVHAYFLLAFYGGTKISKIITQIKTLPYYMYSDHATQNDARFTPYLSIFKYISGGGGTHELAEGTAEEQGKSALPVKYDIETFIQECAKLSTFEELGNMLCFFHINVLKAYVLYLFEHYKKAKFLMDAIKPFIVSVQSMVLVPFFYFYDTLIHLAIIDDIPLEEQKDGWDRVHANQKQLESYRNYSYENIEHKYAMVEAEIARHKHQYERAFEWYDQAIERAKKHEFIHEEALANELAAQFFLSRGKTKIARIYLWDARYLYQRWGSNIKAFHLDQKYAPFYNDHFFEQSIKPQAQHKETTSDSRLITDKGISMLDWTTVIKASQAISQKIVLEELLKDMMRIVIENAGAEKGFLIMEEDSKWLIQAEGSVNQGLIQVQQKIPIEPDSQYLDTLPVVSSSVVYYVIHTKRPTVLNDAAKKGRFTNDSYIQRVKPKSILCTPLIYQNKLMGLLYLENNLTTNAFTEDRLHVLDLISSQIVISIENARNFRGIEELSKNLERKVEERTSQLAKKNDELSSAMNKLKEFQKQVVFQEKMASLGGLTAGIAHEIKNPLNFIYNFADLSNELADELTDILSPFMNPSNRSASVSETLDPHQGPLHEIQSILSDIQGNMVKIRDHSQRANSIVNSMLLHSRSAPGEFQSTDVNALLKEYVNLSYHGMRAKDNTFNISIEESYDSTIGLIECVPQNLCRVFLNIISNACYATQEKLATLKDGYAPILRIASKNISHQVEIRIYDNGLGIPESIRSQIFEPFFTTKPVGSGTGLGLSISYDIVVEEHRGMISVDSKTNQYTEFVITLPKIQYSSNTK